MARKQSVDLHMCNVAIMKFSARVFRGYIQQKVELEVHNQMSEIGF